MIDLSVLFTCHASMSAHLTIKQHIIMITIMQIIYEYLMLVTWITYSYEKWDDIHSEIGRYIVNSLKSKKDVILCMR